MLEIQGKTPAADATVSDAGAVTETTTTTFAADVLQASREKPVLVDFWAPWCGPCKQLGPVLERVAKKAGDKIKIVKMNIDEHPAVAGQLGIQSIPAVIAFAKGQPVDGFMGALPEAQVMEFVERIAGPVTDAEDVIAEADAALAEGNVVAAGELYAAVLAEDETNVAALAGLARAQLMSGSAEAASAILDRVPPAKSGDAKVAAVRAEIALASQSAGLGETGELMAKVEADPDDHQARFDLAVALGAAGQRKEAVDHLLAIIRKDREWNEDGARKQLVQFFDAWGPTDPATRDGRRRLSSVLFA
ncbi:thioredoxin [Agaricicola taiwanensis]|uniref:Thioredoxin n=1 Tax=Agaricicola taiwanensis TaxID=591372 RepID=A0A8J2VIY2_9RHOB|nr:thioredoxin [Agaricicola taiwanensis]GGE27940.1 thioredoxin [Agaricicola taiwanensis]